MLLTPPMQSLNSTSLGLRSSCENLGGRVLCDHKFRGVASHRPYVSKIHCAEGFGNGKKSKDLVKGKKSTGNKLKDLAGLDASDRKVVEKALKLVDGPKVRPIDPNEAARGKVDFVQVKDWGSGQYSDLGELQVADEQQTSNASPVDGEMPPEPFYDQLARRLDLLRKQGQLSLARPPGAPPLPRFEHWSFRHSHYIQYLMDQLAVHVALENAVDSCADVGGRHPSAPAHTHSQKELATARKVLGMFHGLQCGLERSRCIVHDLDLMAKAAPQGEPIIMQPAAQAASYSAYLEGLMRKGLDRDSELPVAKRRDSMLKLLAHLYSVHVTHLTTGLRIGAAAAEKLDLFPIQAVEFYQHYPSTAADPMAKFVALMNAAGAELGPSHQDVVMDELPRAFQKTSLLFSSLARDD